MIASSLLLRRNHLLFNFSCDILGLVDVQRIDKRTAAASVVNDHGHSTFQPIILVIYLFFTRKAKLEAANGSSLLEKSTNVTIIFPYG